MFNKSRFLLSAVLAALVASTAPAQNSFSSSSSSVILRGAGAAAVQIPFWRQTRPASLRDEAARLSNLHDSAFAQSRFGPKTRHGFLLKDLSGPVLLQSNATMKFQPASTLKVVPYAMAIDYAARGIWQELDAEALNWIGAVPESGQADNPCDLWLKQHATVSKVSRSAPISEVLPTMMYTSDNALHEALLRKIGPVA